MVYLYFQESNLGSHDGVFCFTPHSRPINCLQFHPTDPQKLYSGSYDGTIRCGVFEKGVFDEVSVRLTHWPLGDG